MTEISDPAVARRRRKAIIHSQRSESASGDAPATATTTSSSDDDVPPNHPKRKAEKPQETDDDEEEDCERKAKVSKSNKDNNKDNESKSNSKKTQIRYDPDVPMSKEQLAAWRREARRVRNRESAAASRQRIRNRITELEDEVADWKSKYAEAMQRLRALERGNTNNRN